MKARQRWRNSVKERVGGEVGEAGREYWGVGFPHCKIGLGEEGHKFFTTSPIPQALHLCLFKLASDAGSFNWLLSCPAAAARSLHCAAAGPGGRRPQAYLQAIEKLGLEQIALGGIGVVSVIISPCPSSILFEHCVLIRSL